MDITFFEIHLDGAQFGPETIGEGMMSEETRGKAKMAKRMRGKAMREERAADEGEESGESSRSFVRRAARFVPVIVVFGIAGYAASRRFRGSGDEEMMDVDADAEAVEIEA